MSTVEQVSSDSGVDALATQVSSVKLAASSAPSDEPRFRDKLAVDVVDFEVNGPPSLVPEKPSEAVIGVWEGLNLKPELIRGVRNQGWERPSPPQAWMLPYMLHEQRPSLLGQSKNGSGKTGAFGLAMLNAVDASLMQPQALCMSPTLELADQTAKRLAQLASYLPGVTFDTLTSGAAAKYKGGRRVTAQVLVGSPKTVVNLINTGALSLAALRVFAVDEADQMISNSSYVADMKAIMSAARRRPAAGGGAPLPQVLLFSASFNALDPEHSNFVPRAREIVDDFLDTKRPGARPVVTIVASGLEALAVENVTHFVARVRPRGSGEDAENAARNELLLAIYATLSGGKAIVFATKKRTVDAACAALAGDGRKPVVLRGGVPPEVRQRAIENFNSGASDLLIATDVAQKGLDFKGMRLVVNYELPQYYNEELGRFSGSDHAAFQHRCGRVGRLGQGPGVCVHIIANKREADTFDELKSKFVATFHELPIDNPDKVMELIDAAFTSPLRAPGDAAPAVPVPAAPAATTAAAAKMSSEKVPAAPEASSAAAASNAAPGGPLFHAAISELTPWGDEAGKTGK